ncbi:MAG: endonuclease/exonuclease/phosphatase family protein [Bacteroidales bacterium]
MRKLFSNILLGINIFLALSLLISYLAVHINPEDFILPAFFGLLYPYLLIINIILAVIWAVNLRFYALISVVCIVIGFNHISNYIRPARPATNNDHQFTLMSYNVRLFNKYEGPGTESSENDVVELVADIQPDILCLQEYYAESDWDKLTNLFAASMGSGIESHVKMSGRGRGSFYGIATFSRFPIVNRGEIIHPDSPGLTIYTDILIESDTFRVFNNHLQSFRLRRMERSFVSEMIGVQEQRVSELSGLFASLRDGFVKRAAQANVIKAFIDTSPYPVIVTGDFNDTPVSYSYRRIRKGLTDTFLKSGYGAGFTYKGNYPPNRIDYILHDSRLKSTSYRVIGVRYSDHYPVIGGFVVMY